MQPYIALGLKKKGNEVTLTAPSGIKEFIEGFGISYAELYAIKREHEKGVDNGVKEIEKYFGWNPWLFNIYG